MWEFGDGGWEKLGDDEVMGKSLWWTDATGKVGNGRGKRKNERCAKGQVEEGRDFSRGCGEEVLSGKC